MNPVVGPELRTWARAAISQIGAKVRPLKRRGRRALLIHLDGVPRALLARYVQSGQMPFLSSLVRSGEYRMDDAFWGSPASTPCFQAGLLYGVRHPNLPAYLWYDRELGRRVRMSTPQDTAVMEARLNRREDQSLLAGGGTAYCSLFSAGAANRLSMTALADKCASARAFAKTLEGLPEAARGDALSYFRHLLRGIGHTTREVVKWVRQVGDCRHEREYLMNRVLMGLAWDYAHRRAMVDMVRGVPVIYLVFGTYDEISHRRGPRSLESNRELWRVDAALAELYAVARTLEDPYDVYFFTDHGHVECAPLEQRSGRSLAAGLREGRCEPLPDETRRGLLDGRPAPARSLDLDPPIVVDAGNFSHVYLGDGRRPLDAREVLARAPDVLARAVRHPDVAVAVVRRGAGAVALAGGELFEADQLHRAPLPEAFSRPALADLLKELPHMPNAGDVVLYGQTVGEGTVAFAWEFGSHGGLTTTETDSVICWPRNAPVDLFGLSHSVQLHERLSEVYRAG